MPVACAVDCIGNLLPNNLLSQKTPLFGSGYPSGPKYLQTKCTPVVVDPSRFYAQSIFHMPPQSQRATRLQTLKRRRDRRRSRSSNRHSQAPEVDIMWILSHFLCALNAALRHYFSMFLSCAIQCAMCGLFTATVCVTPFAPDMRESRFGSLLADQSPVLHFAIMAFVTVTIGSLFVGRSPWPYRLFKLFCYHNKLLVVVLLVCHFPVFGRFLRVHTRRSKHARTFTVHQRTARPWIASLLREGLSMTRCVTLPVLLLVLVRTLATIIDFAPVLVYAILCLYAFHPVITYGLTQAHLLYVCGIVLANLHGSASVTPRPQGGTDGSTRRVRRRNKRGRRSYRRGRRRIGLRGGGGEGSEPSQRVAKTIACVSKTYKGEKRITLVEPEDYSRLPQGWLNDTLIDAYAFYLQTQHLTSTTCVMSAHLMGKLRAMWRSSEFDENVLARWLTKAGIERLQDYRYLVLPINVTREYGRQAPVPQKPREVYEVSSDVEEEQDNTTHGPVTNPAPCLQGMHWVLCVVRLPRSEDEARDYTITFLDSLEGCYDREAAQQDAQLITEAVSKYWESSAENDLPESIANFSPDQIKFAQVTRQDNSVDCGVFTLAYLHQFLTDVQLWEDNGACKMDVTSTPVTRQAIAEHLGLPYGTTNTPSSGGITQPSSEHVKNEVHDKPLMKPLHLTIPGCRD